MYNYLLSFVCAQEQEQIEADEKVKRAKYLIGKQIKESKFKLRTNVQQSNCEIQPKKILPDRPLWAQRKKKNTPPPPPPHPIL